MNNLVDITEKFETKPLKLPLIQMFRIGLFQMGLGIISLLIAGLLNRLMINELTIPATLAAGFIAVLLFVSQVYAFEMSGGRSGTVKESQVLGGLSIATVEEALKLALHTLHQCDRLLPTNEICCKMICKLAV